MTAWEMTLQDTEPPYPSFSAHSTAGLRRPFSRLYDRRWHEAVLASVHADEEMRERRRKLVSWQNPSAQAAAAAATAAAAGADAGADGTRGAEPGSANPKRKPFRGSRAQPQPSPD